MRHLAFVIAAALAALLTSQSPTRGAPPATTPTVRLVYTVPIDTAAGPAMDQGLVPALAETVSRVQARLPEGAKVALSGAAGFTVDVGNADPAALAHVRRCVESQGKLELRALANNAHRRGNEGFDLEGERKRLQAWLDSGGRERLYADANALDAFHADPARRPVAGPMPRWYVHRITMNPDDVGHWHARFVDHPDLQLATLPAFTAKDWNDGTIPGHIQALPAPRRYLVELVATDPHELHFANRDFAAAGLATARASGSPTMRLIDPRDAFALGDDPAIKAGTTPAMWFRIIGARASDFAIWSEKHTGHPCAVLWDGEVVAVPRIENRIPGQGLIHGAFSADQILLVLAALKAPPLEVKPQLVRQEPLAK